MKGFKKVFIVVLLFSMVAGLIACGQSNDDFSQSGQEVSNENFKDWDNKRMDWGFNSPDIYGEVKSISGNKLTLALIEIPQRKQPTEEDMQKMKERRQDISNGDNGEQKRFIPNEGEGNPPNAQDRNKFDGPPPDMKNNGDGANGNGGNERKGGRDMMGMAQRKFTGENQEIEIPSSASITTFERGNNEISEKKIAIEDVKVGMTVQIWYKKDNGDKKEIEQVRVMQVPTTTNNKIE